jgi:hypothetical protein
MLRSLNTRSIDDERLVLVLRDERGKADESLLHKALASNLAGKTQASPYSGLLVSKCSHTVYSDGPGHEQFRPALFNELASF